MRNWSGENNPRWKGGRILNKGYWKLRKPNHPTSNKRGYIAEHRFLMEQELSRLLKKEEKVHHINFDKLDNRIENLYLCKNSSKHQKIQISIQKIIKPLLEKRIIEFKNGEYRLRE